MAHGDVARLGELPLAAARIASLLRRVSPRFETWIAVLVLFTMEADDVVRLRINLEASPGRRRLPV
jgi:hypothetical protein